MSDLDLEQAVYLRVRYSTAMVNDEPQMQNGFEAKRSHDIDVGGHPDVPQVTDQGVLVGFQLNDAGKALVAEWAQSHAPRRAPESFFFEAEANGRIWVNGPGTATLQIPADCFDPQREPGVRAEPGATYHGPILHLGSDHLLQDDTRDAQFVRHDLRALVGAKLSVGDVVEVRYPHGSVGVVTPAHKLATQGLEHSLNHDMRAHHTQQEMER